MFFLLLSFLFRFGLFFFSLSCLLLLLTRPTGSTIFFLNVLVGFFLRELL
jgi:hypothetical protein